MTASRPSILVGWADGDAENMGLRVLASGAQSLAQSVWGSNTNVVLQSHNTPGTMLNRRHVLADIGRANGAMTARLRTFDAVIDTCGGDSFTDIYGLRRLILLAYVHRAAGKAGVPVFLSPQTIGPFNTAIGRMIARRVLRGAAFVATRDPASSECSTSLGRAVDCEATDVAFALPVPTERPRHGVVVNVSGLLWNPNPHVDHLKYRRETERLIEELLGSDRAVHLLAHVVNSGVADDDVPAVNEVRDRFAGRVEAHTPSSLGEVREVLAGATAVVGARLHACLNALSVGTPAIPWAYSRKFEPLMNSLNYPYCIDLRSSLSASEETLELVGNVTSTQFQSTVKTTSDIARARLDELVAGMRRVAAKQSSGYEL